VREGRGKEVNAGKRVEGRQTENGKRGRKGVEKNVILIPGSGMCGGIRSVWREAGEEGIIYRPQQMLVGSLE